MIPQSDSAEPAEPAPKQLGRWRYVVPNAVTCLSVLFGVLALQAALRGHAVEGAWWGLLVTLTDKADGFLAVRLKATSSFGVQLDSLADLVAFGVVPGAITYAFYSTRPELGWTSGWQSLALMAVTSIYTIAAALRLARFNIGAEKRVAAGERSRHYSGVPTTMTAGILLALFLMLVKYSAPPLALPDALDHWRIFGGIDLQPLLRLFPWLLVLGAWGMLSNLAVPSLGRTFSRATDALLALAVAFGYAMGVMRHLPEYLVGGGLWYLAVAFVHTARRASHSR